MAAPALDIASNNRRKRGREGYKSDVQTETGLGITN
jgi:beta-glucosidase-like glycosyl hydrolase